MRRGCLATFPKGKRKQRFWTGEQVWLKNREDTNGVRNLTKGLHRGPVAS